MCWLEAGVKQDCLRVKRNDFWGVKHNDFIFFWSQSWSGVRKKRPRLLRRQHSVWKTERMQGWSWEPIAKSGISQTHDGRMWDRRNESVSHSNIKFLILFQKSHFGYKTRWRTTPMEIGEATFALQLYLAALRATESLRRSKCCQMSCFTLAGDAAVIHGDIICKKSRRWTAGQLWEFSSATCPRL